MSKHPKTRLPSGKDLKTNPGIGTSKGAAKQGDETEADGDSTFQGDVENDTTPGGGIDPRHTGRTNK